MNRSAINDHNEADFIATCDELLDLNQFQLFSHSMHKLNNFKDEASFLKSRPNLKTFLATSTYGAKKTKFMC